MRAKWHAPGYTNTPKDLQALERLLIESIREIVYDNKEKSFKQVKDELDNAENHVNWRPRREKSTPTLGNISINRTEKPISTFIPELEEEWLAILNKKNEQPQWFTALPEWEQTYFQKRIREHQALPRRKRPELGEFLGPVPTTIRRYPGAPNAYVTEVTFEKGPETSKFILTHRKTSALMQRM